MINQTLVQYFHWYYNDEIKLWKKVSAEAKSLKDLGITGAWLPPAYKSTEGENSVGYDCYDLFDLGEFDQKGSVPTRYGTKDEYLQAIKALHDQEIMVVADVVFNHKAGADELEKIPVKRVNPENRAELISDQFEIEAWTKFTFPGRKGKYSEFIWDKSCFSGIDWAEDLQETAIFSIQNEYGEGWEDVLDKENGNYDYLMLTDIDFRNPHVREELKHWGKWFQETTGIDGFRLDAIKHMPADFYNEWLDYMRSETGAELFTVGEYWSPYDLQSLLDYIELTGGRMSLFDACLQANFSRASKAGEQFDLCTIFDGSLVQVKPDLAVTLVENHDTQPLQSLEQTVEPWFRAHAYAMILLRAAGYPCVFYSDVYGSHYTDTGTDGKDHEVTMAPLPQLANLLEARKKYAYGEQKDYFDHGSCVGWVRTGDEEHENSGLAVVLSNGDKGFKAMEMGRAFAGKKLIDCLGHCEGEVVINEEGWGEFHCEPGSVSVWIVQ